MKSAKTRAVVRRSSLHLAWKSVPSRSTTQQVSGVKWRHRLDKLRSALGHLLRCRLRRLRNSSRLRRQSHGRPCPRSKLMFPSPLRKCFIFTLFSQNLILIFYPFSFFTYFSFNFSFLL